MDETPKTDDGQMPAAPQGDQGMPPQQDVPAPGSGAPQEGTPPAPEEAPKEDGDKPAGGAW